MNIVEKAQDSSNGRPETQTASQPGIFPQPSAPGRAADETGKALDPEMVNQALEPGHFFHLLNEFWIKTSKDLPELRNADDARCREMHTAWTHRYNDMLEKIMGTSSSEKKESSTEARSEKSPANSSGFESMWGVWFKAMPQWMEHSAKLMQGDLSAVAEGFTLWGDVYNRTFGRFFKMPAFGLAKEHVERASRAYGAFFQLTTSLPFFLQYFPFAAMAAVKEASVKVKQINLENVGPDTLREVYKIWLASNEKAFFELFKSPDFSRSMGELLNYALGFKKYLNELTDEWLEAMSIPSSRDHDRLARTVQELRRKIRDQQKSIEALAQQIEINKEETHAIVG